MTGNAHKESWHKLSLILVKEKRLKQSKLMVAAKWWLLSQSKKNYLMASLLFDVLLPFYHLHLWY